MSLVDTGTTDTSGACPRCGDDLQAISTQGPTEHVAQPCGCLLSTLEVRRLQERDS